jgi:hypothetical protein
MAATAARVSATELGRKRLGFFLATRRQSEVRVRVARRVAQHQAWTALRSGS